ncbi:HNH endonuclease [Arthrobacter rhombi]|uniref:HNH endonuclease n=1 Tax=Arthrobacter rhombi TaxID=71253 RepID=UPI003FD58DA0
MPKAPKKCNKDGCWNTVVGRGFCAEHRPMNWQGDKRSSTAGHKAWRVAVLDRANWWCQIRGPRCEGRAKFADHIVNVKRGGAHLDLSNGQAACKTCHDQKTQAEAQAGRKLSQTGVAPPPPPGH